MLPTATHDLQSCLDRVDNLGVFPEAAQQILSVTQHPDSTLADLEEAVACDPVLSARVLQVANSPLYGLQSRVGTLRRAVQMLGLDGTRGVAFALAVSALGREGSDVARDLYDHSLATGAVVKLLASHVPAVHAGLMYATALVHDLGLQLLLLLEPESTQTMLIKLGHNKKLVHAERLHFGFDHAQLGAAGLLRWGLPEPAAELVQLHHQPLAGKHRARALIQVADHIAEGLMEDLEADDLADRGRWHPAAPLLCVPPTVWDNMGTQLPDLIGQMQ